MYYPLVLPGLVALHDVKHKRFVIIMISDYSLEETNRDSVKQRFPLKTRRLFASSMYCVVIDAKNRISDKKQAGLSTVTCITDDDSSIRICK